MMKNNQTDPRPGTRITSSCKPKNELGRALFKRLQRSTSENPRIVIALSDDERRIYATQVSYKLDSFLILKDAKFDLAQPYQQEYWVNIEQIKHIRIVD